MSWSLLIHWFHCFRRGNLGDICCSEAMWGKILIVTTCCWDRCYHVGATQCSSDAQILFCCSLDDRWGRGEAQRCKCGKNNTNTTHSCPGPFIFTGKTNTPKWSLSLHKATQNSHCKNSKVSHNWPLGMNEHYWKQETCQINIRALRLRIKILVKI